MDGNGAKMEEARVVGGQLPACGLNSELSANADADVKAQGDSEVIFEELAKDGFRPLSHAVANAIGDAAANPESFVSTSTDAPGTPEIERERRGYAPVKPQFIAVSASRENGPSITSASPAERTREDPGGTENRKRKRGQNKQRPRDKRAQDADKLCPSLLREESCAFGEESCRFSHDKKTYWDSRLPDLGSYCPNFDSRGFCQYGLACRFAGSHVDPETLTNRRKQTSSPVSNGQQQTNVFFSVETRTRLRKRTYDFSAPDSVVADVKQRLGSELAGSSSSGINIQDSSEQNLDSGSSISPVDNCDSSQLREPRLSRRCISRKRYLAPLTTIGNLPFRRICVEYGAEVTCGQQSEWSLIKRHASEKLFGVQLAGSTPESLARCCHLLLEEGDVDFIDLNLGCPIDLVCNHGAGCTLMKRNRRLQECVASMAAVIHAKDDAEKRAFLSVKMRTGVYDSKPIARDCVEKLRPYASLLTLHGRSKEQRYTKLADWSYIGECALTAQPVPLYGCGDVLTFEEYHQKLEEFPDLGGIMLARGAMIKPWLFTEVAEKRHWDISSSERFDIIKRYVDYGLEHFGSDQQGVNNTRRFLLEWMSFLHRYIPVGILERPVKINEKPPLYVGRDDMETLMASRNCADWIKLTERTILGKVPDDFQFLPKHKANSY